MKKEEIREKIRIIEKELDEITMQINSKDYNLLIDERDILKNISLIAEVKAKIEYLKKYI